MEGKLFVGLMGFERRWRIVELANPAVATDWTLKADGGAWWRVISVAARLVADANVANRRATFFADNQTRNWWVSHTSNVVTNGQTVDYCGHTSAAMSDGTGVFTFPLPANGLLLPPGHRLRVVTTNIQAGDQWSSITAQVDEIPSDEMFVGDGIVTVIEGK
jgi:hypothetical protein